MPLMLTASTVLIAALQVSGGGATDLFCRGQGDRLIQTQVKVRKADGSVVTRSESGSEPFNGAIRIKISGDSGQALIPEAMLEDDDARGWHDLKKLVVSDNRIDGKIYMNWLYSPVFSLNRRSGAFRVSGSMSNFTGTCTRYNPATSRLPAPRIAARPTPRASGYVDDYDAPRAPSYGGGDPRAAARAMANRMTVQDSAMRSDLAFRLFNAGNSPIVEFVMMGTSGSKPSGNWLRPGEQVAPRAFRSMTFADGRRCDHNVRITYADSSRLIRPVNLCGKDVLYADGRDIWAE